MSEDLEQAAERIAERGREALLARLRPAFREAAEAHADVLELTPEQLEEMVQKAADRADGLQWRRALAAVACEELEIPLSQALGHEAVARAQELVGAPSYEESLAELSRAAGAAKGEETGGGGEGEEAETGPAAEEEAQAGPAAEEEAQAGPAAEEEAQAGPAAEEEAPPTVEEAEAQAEGAEDAGEEDEHEEEDAAREWEQEELATMQYELHEIDEHEDEEHFDDEDAPELRIAAIHIGGIANLSPGERGIELKLAEPGLDILRAEGDVLGRLEWDQVRTLEVVPPPRRRRRRSTSHLVIRTERGDASFEALALSQEELREQLTPILELYLPGAG